MLILPELVAKISFEWRSNCWTKMHQHSSTIHHFVIFRRDMTVQQIRSCLPLCQRPSSSPWSPPWSPTTSSCAANNATHSPSSFVDYRVPLSQMKYNCSRLLRSSVRGAGRKEKITDGVVWSIQHTSLRGCSEEVKHLRDRRLLRGRGRNRRLRGGRHSDRGKKVQARLSLAVNS